MASLRKSPMQKFQGHDGSNCSESEVDLIDQLIEQGATPEQIALVQLYVQHPVPQHAPRLIYHAWSICVCMNVL